MHCVCTLFITDLCVCTMFITDLTPSQPPFRPSLLPSSHHLTLSVPHTIWRSLCDTISLSLQSSLHTPLLTCPLPNPSPLFISCSHVSSGTCLYPPLSQIPISTPPHLHSSLVPYHQYLSGHMYVSHIQYTMQVYYLPLPYIQHWYHWQPVHSPHLVGTC